MLQNSDSIFHTPDPVWHETHHLLDDKPYDFPDESKDLNAKVKVFSLRERFILKSGSLLIRLGNGLIGKVEENSHKPQAV